MSKEAVNTDDEMLDLMNELAEIVGHYAYSNTTNLDIHHAVKELRTLILADRKKHELQARIDEWNRLISIARINGERVINQATYSLALDRIAELSQTLKEHKEAEL